MNASGYTMSPLAGPPEPLQVYSTGSYVVARPLLHSHNNNILHECTLAHYYNNSKYT